MIDAATGDSRHLDALGEALGTGGLARVLVTHGHSDHAAGSGAIAERWPDAEFLKKPWPDRDARYAVNWTPVPEAGEIPTGDTTLRPIHTPGHAPDHLCFFEEASRTLFCGDLLVQGATVVIPVSGGGSLTDYLASLQQILELKPATVLPAHGPEIEDPAPLIEHYYDHRRRREEQVVDRPPGWLHDARGARRTNLPGSVVGSRTGRIGDHLGASDQASGRRASARRGWRVVPSLGR